MGAMRGSKQESSWCCRQPQETGGSCYSLARSDRNTENQGWVYPVPGMVFVVPVVFFFLGRVFVVPTKVCLVHTVFWVPAWVFWVPTNLRSRACSEHI